MTQDAFVGATRPPGPFMHVNAAQMAALARGVDEKFIDRLWRAQHAQASAQLSDDERSRYHDWLRLGRQSGFRTEYELAVFTEYCRVQGRPFLEGESAAGIFAKRAELPARARAERLAIWLDELIAASTEANNG